MTKKPRGIRLLADNTPKGLRKRKVRQTVLEFSEQNVLGDNTTNDSGRVS
jgi:hypothetical protein